MTHRSRRATPGEGLSAPAPFHALAEHLTFGVYRTTPGPRGAFLEANPALLRMLGCADLNELLSLEVCSFYERPAERLAFSERLSREGHVTGLELTLLRRDGSPFVASEQAVAVRDREGRIVCFEGVIEDMTGRKETERQYGLQKTYLEQLFNSAPEAIALHDGQDRVMEINPEFTLLFGYSREEAIGRRINDLVAPAALSREAAEISRRVIAGERIELESKRKRKDGTLIDVSILGAPIVHQGKQVGDYAIYRDISARKRDEEALRVQRAYHDSLLNSAPEAIVFHNLDDIVVDVNAEFVRMFGFGREEAIGRPINSLVASPEMRTEAEGLSADVVHGRRVEVETKRRRRDGTLFDVSILGAPIFHEGNQIGVYAIYRDITERKNAEEQILLQKTYFERLFNSAPEAVLLHGNDDLVMDVNEEFVRMFGYSREEAKGRQVNDLVVPPELLEEAAGYAATSLRGERVEAETKRRRKDGVSIDVSLLCAPILHEGRQIGAYAIYRDITERRRAEELRVRAEEEARMARNIQRHLLPSANPDVEGFEIAGKTEPAMNVGGDYYDFIRLDDHRLAIGIGDVSGNGLAASLVMANLQATIRGQALTGSDPARCLERANTLLYRSTDARTFVSIFYGILDRRTGALTYANAGQNPPVLFSAEAPPKELRSRGIALGLAEHATYDAETVTLRPGETLLLITDGIVEAMNDEMEEFGEERMKESVIRYRDEPASAIVDGVFGAAREHVAHSAQHDDMTVVILKRR